MAEEAEMIEISIVPRNGSTRKNQIFPAEIPEKIPQDSSSIHVNPPLDSWLPITESRNGNAYYSAFHMISSGIGFQAFTLPVAFTLLGWAWGTIWLTVAFIWQFYTIWLLVRLQESVPGKRYDRYLQLSKAAFGEKLGVVLGLFPVIYLSSGASAIIVMTAGDMMKLLMKITSEPGTKSLPLTTTECYVIFVLVAVVLALFLPNLNSVAWISFIGASAAVSYCTLIWAISVSKTRPNGISYDRVVPKSDVGSVLSVFNGIGIIALAFRGHNLILEIQATLPTSEGKPSRLSMLRGANFAYSVIALSYYPLAIAGYWAYGDKLINQGGVLNALHNFHGHDTSKFLLVLTCTLVLIHCVCSYQIYAMPTLDNLTFAYISKKKNECPKPIRLAFRVAFGCLTLFIAVAIPFLRGLAGLMGGISLPLTFAFPCFMWIAIKKPQRWSAIWCANLVLGSIGVMLGGLVFCGGIWTLIQPGINVRFFKP